MSKFGEPWKTVETEDGTNIHDKNNEHVYFEGIYDSGFNMSEINIPRTVACVNALAGVGNPEVVTELLEWIDTALKSGDYHPDEILESLFNLMEAIQFTEDESCEK